MTATQTLRAAEAARKCTVAPTHMTDNPSVPPGPAPSAISPSPTPYAALNAVLGFLVARAREVLGDNFIGAYLQGSFALGGFDEASDADFLIVVARDIPDADVPALNAMHAGIHGFPPPWGHRLEGSYVPAPILRRSSGNPRDPPGAPRPPVWTDPGTGAKSPRLYPFWFLDHGARTLVRSEHDNSRVVRWVTREKGIVLAGPHPRDLIDAVSPDALRAEMRETMTRVAAMWLSRPAAIETLWLQAFFVGLYCRMLHTLHTGTVSSKKTAAEWAMATLAPRWRSLIARSVGARPAISLGPADPRAVTETLAFVEYAMRWTGNLRNAPAS
jgi:Aminoglycoside adenylyltransferase, C-terminal domain